MSETTATTEVAELTARPWVLWEWQHHALEYETHATLRDAVEAALHAEDAGTASFERIEGPGTAEEIAAMWETVQAEMDAASEERRVEWATRPKVQWVVQVTLPSEVGWGGTKAWGLKAPERTHTVRVAHEHERAAADESAAQWIRRVGAHRVAVVTAAEAGIRS